MPFTIFVPILLAGIAVLAVGGYLLIGKRDSSNAGQAKRPKKQQRTRDRSAILRDANRRLSNNPRDHEALRSLADLYFEEQAWDKAMKSYGVLVNMAATNSDVNEFEVTARHGLSALQLNDYETAYKDLLLARSMNTESFEVEYNLGYLEFRRGNAERAVQLLTNANGMRPEHIPTQRYLGRALYKGRRYKDAQRHLRAVVDAEPEDREALFYLAQSHYELGQNDQALAIYTHLRPDPVLGAHAALYAGSIRASKRDYEQAIIDFELGLRHEKVRPEVELEMRYRLADTYIKQQDLGKAIANFSQIHEKDPGFKDVAAQLAKYRELHGNRHLQTYLLSSMSEFITLCRRMVMTFHRNAKVKVLDVQVQKAEYVDILTEVETASWEDVILFRFIRSTGQVGELVVREFNSRLKETRAGRGYCLTAGNYSDTAYKYVEARLIDLLDKPRLVETLNRID